jgi:hypothetical protein
VTAFHDAECAETRRAYLRARRERS